MAAANLSSLRAHVRVLAACLALGLGSAASPAFAQQPPPPIAVSKAMAKPLTEAQAAINAQDWAATDAKLNEAAGKAKTPGDNFHLAKLRYLSAVGKKDAVAQAKSIEAMLATNLVPAEDVKSYKAGLAKAYLDAGDEAKSTQITRAYIDEYGGTGAQYILIADQALKANDYATALAYADKAIAASSANGAKAPETYYRFVMRVYNAQKDMPKYFEAEEKAVAAYPKDDYWKELITTRTRMEPGYQAAASQIRLDTYRALAAANVKLTADEKVGYADEALTRALPTEALAVLKAAFDSGEIGGPGDAKAAERKQLLALTQSKVKTEKDGLAQEEKDAAKASGDTLAALGEVFLAQGDYAKAADYIQKGLTKGIPNAGKADVARLHLGIAQFKAGQAAAATAIWAEIKSDNGTKALARAWTLIAGTPK